MRLYKTIDYDKKLIEEIKSGEYPNWTIIFENDLYCDLQETPIE